ncbi:MAG: zinc-binding alcohol dehydrogenase family protein [Verrucomicrobia bacterium]|nr:zinc-binding alcohol dehydrogenase family protein [Verrucomicrobiota bacterium]
MRALRFEKTGSLDELSVRDVPIPMPAPGEVLVQIKAAAINPSDIKNVLGKMHETTLPRTPGRDFAGVLVDDAGERSGQAVFGSGGNLGFGRDGSHAEYLAVPANAGRPMPKNLSFEQAAGIGIPHVTAWAALVNAARLQLGETVLILGTTGAVGRAAAYIAHQLGARVIGTVRKAADLPGPGAVPVDEWINLETTALGAGVRNLTDRRGAQVVFDVVGGAMFEPCLAALAWRGRQVAISSSPEPRVSFNLVDFYHNESRRLGVDSLKLSFEEAAGILGQLTPGIEAGTIPPPLVESFPLEAGPGLYRDVAASKLKTKPILIP